MKEGKDSLIGYEKSHIGKPSARGTSMAHVLRPTHKSLVPDSLRIYLNPISLGSFVV